jgi:hypothetical protein
MAGKDSVTMVELQRKDTEGHEVVKGILNALAGWAGSETLQHLKRTRNEISQEVISDKAHKVPQNDQQQRKKARTTAKNGE